MRASGSHAQKRKVQPAESLAFLGKPHERPWDNLKTIKVGHALACPESTPQKVREISTVGPTHRAKAFPWPSTGEGCHTSIRLAHSYS